VTTLIYCRRPAPDEPYRDENALSGFELDLAFGTDQNDFVCTTSLGRAVLRAGDVLYVDGTEYGGLVSGYEYSSSKGTVAYSGPSFQGILDEHLLRAAPGEDYYTASGEANAVLAAIVEQTGTGGLFRAAAEDSGFQVSRQATVEKGYEFVRRMLDAVGARLECRWRDGMVDLRAVAVRDLTEADELNTYDLKVKVKRALRPVNHLLCLGRGELAERTRIDLYLDAQGQVSEQQTYSGLDEVCEVYDYPNVESADALLEAGTKKLLEYATGGTVSAELGSADYGIGDVIGAVEPLTRALIKASVSQKVVKLTPSSMSVSYKVGVL